MRAERARDGLRDAAGRPRFSHEGGKTPSAGPDDRPSPGLCHLGAPRPALGARGRRGAARRMQTRSALPLAGRPARGGAGVGGAGVGSQAWAGHSSLPAWLFRRVSGGEAFVSGRVCTRCFAPLVCR